MASISRSVGRNLHQKVILAEFLTAPSNATDDVAFAALFLPHVVVHTRRDVSDGVQNIFHETFEAVHLFVASFEARVKNPARQTFFLRLDFRFRFCA